MFATRAIVRACGLLWRSAAALHGLKLLPQGHSTGHRCTVQVRRTTGPDVVLNNLFKHTSLQGRFPCNMVALVHGNPVSLTLKQFLQHFLGFRCGTWQRLGPASGCCLLHAAVCPA